VGTTRASLAKRCFGAGVTAMLLAGVVAGPVSAARSTGPTISSVTFDPNVPCKVYVTYTGRGKNAQIDMWAQSWGYTTPTDTVAGYDIWAGSESRNGPMSSGSYTAVFQLADGGHLKQFTTWGWAYRVEGVTLDKTISPTYSFNSVCVFPNYDYTVKFHDGYTTGDAGFLPALQQSVKFDQLITEPTPPTRAGYIFAGWSAYYQGYLGPHPASGYWDFASDKMTDFDTVMYAQWTPAG
jgi:uncharacterized repeat protein (TIGR02543 family)